MSSAFALQATAGGTAFYAVFGLFVLAMVALIAVVLVWAIRRDKAGRAAWVRRHLPPDDGVEHPESGAR